MVLGIGTDIIEIDRIGKAFEKNSFSTKYFTNAEISLFEKNGIQSIAGNFAAKESVSKALGTGFINFGLRDIEILRDKKGQPFVNLHNGAKLEADSQKIKKIKVSISHCQKYAVAFVIAIG